MKRSKLIPLFSFSGLLLGDAAAAKASFAVCLELKRDHLWADRLARGLR